MATITSTTNENLRAAFAGESQANQKYRAFAKKAEQDGLPNIARLFRTAAEAERIHAEGHLKALDGIGSSVENLQAAVDGETYEFTEMYPPMLAQAEVETHKAKRMFGYAVEAEAVHARIYALALEAARQGKDLAQAQIYLCPVCGYIELGQSHGRLPDLRNEGGQVRRGGLRHWPCSQGESVRRREEKDGQNAHPLSFGGSSIRGDNAGQPPTIPEWRILATCTGARIYCS